MNDEQLIRFLLRETSPEEDADIRSWLDADPANRKHYTQLESIWEASRNLLNARAADPDLAWERFKLRRDAQQPEKAVVRTLGRAYWMKYAAAVLVALSAWVVYSYLTPDQATVLTAANTTTRTLPDGSRITVNRNTSLRYPETFAENGRSVTLDSGEVFFNVSPDKERPFVIHAEDITVRVVGTSFNVKYTGSGTEVVVETGIVEVSGESGKVRLRAGEKVTASGSDGRLVKAAVTDNLHNYYRSRKFTADNTPLSRMLEVLNDAYRANIVLEDTALGDLRLTTTFNDDSSLDTILGVIAETFELKVERNDGQIILRK